MTTEAKILGGIGLASVLLIIAAAFAFGGKSSPSKSIAGVADAKLLVRENSFQTDPKAKVTIVEFGDFQCPACGTAHFTTARIMKEYKGKVNFVFREYPLQGHRYGRLAAQAAEAAGAQGKFFEMEDKLYVNQKEWGDLSSKKDPMPLFLKYAKEIKLDIDKFSKEVKEDTYKSRIERDIDDGNAVGIQATPTFFINGVMHEGGLPYDEFKKLIEEELKK